MDPEVIAEQAGEQTEAIVEAALEQAEAREEAAAEIVEQVTEAARQSEIVRTVEERIAGIESWRDAEHASLSARLSTAEQLLGQMTERLDSLTASLIQPAPEPEPVVELPPEPSIQPEPSNLPESAEDGPRESPAEESKASAKRARAKRRFW